MRKRHEFLKVVSLERLAAREAKLHRTQGPGLFEYVFPGFGVKLSGH